jgi:hypothetical protein
MSNYQAKASTGKDMDAYTEAKGLKPPIPTSSASVTKPKTRISGLNSLLALRTTDDMMSKIEQSTFAWKKLIVQGHICAVIAKPNGGKTTLMTYASGQMAQNGYQVLYVNVDAGASDLKVYHEHAEANGYTLIAPDMVEGHSAKSVVPRLQEMADSGEELSKIVIIFDTLKKFAEVMNKSQGKVFYALLRKLTALGMTAVLLGHTNKYEDKDGKPIYEGTGDLKSDIDELIYLIPIKSEDGSMTVSTDVDKERASTENATFYISPDRVVTESDTYVNTLDQSRELHQHSEDSSVISFILESIHPNCKSLNQLVEISKDSKLGFSRKRLEDVLKRYCGKESTFYKWDRESGLTSGFVYFLPKSWRPLT